MHSMQTEETEMVIEITMRLNMLFYWQLSKVHASGESAAYYMACKLKEHDGALTRLRSIKVLRKVLSTVLNISDIGKKDPKLDPWLSRTATVPVKPQATAKPGESQISR